MFTFAVLIGLYSYAIFILGVLGLLYKNLIVSITIIFIAIVLFWKRKELIRPDLKIKRINNKLLILLISLFIIQVVVNLIGALGPELGFDALWYHLTLPKLYLLYYEIYFIPGGLLYYSAMPKLGEVLYVAGQTFGNEITVKFIHFFFGLLTCLALYKFQRKFFNPLISVIGVLIFYSNLVVAWQSITAYIDLIRTFFEVLALWALINWWKVGRRPGSPAHQKWLILSAVMVGLAITTKVLAVGTLIIISILLVTILIPGRKWGSLITKLLIYWIIALAIPLPWFVFSFIHTGSPVYPFFTSLYKVTPTLFTPLGFLIAVWELFTKSQDPVTPIYLISLPLIIYTFSKFRTEIKIIITYSLLAILIWYFTPPTGGGRFILPYLPAMSVLPAACLHLFLENKNKYAQRYLSGLLIVLIILVSLLSIVFRFAANSKYVPVILGLEAKGKFLSNNLNFTFGDFYDTDNYFKNNIKPNDKVLLLGFHNLYYINFPFIDASYAKEADKFNYIAVQNASLPLKYSNWKLIYKNSKTHVQLYSLGGKKWEYWKY